jgi:hypothetical protein
MIFIDFLYTGGYFLNVKTAVSPVKLLIDGETIQSQFYQYKEKLFAKASQDISKANNIYISF